MQLIVLSISAGDFGSARILIMKRAVLSMFHFEIAEYFFISSNYS
jgi:hypothetical protein